MGQPVLPLPHTRHSLVIELREVGIVPGMTLILHSSIKAIGGWICGGPTAVVQALLDVLTSTGTLIVPTHTATYSDPAAWVNPPVPEAWWPVIREQMPAFDPAITPSEHMGAVSELVRTWPGSFRSSHPTVSFAAIGEHAEHLMRDHALDWSLGESSPLRRIYDMDGYILLLGVGYDVNTSLHLAQYRVPESSSEKDMGAPISEHGVRVWKTYRDLDTSTDDFPAIGSDFETMGHVRLGRIGNATSRLMSQRRMVDFCVSWLQRRYAV